MSPAALAAIGTLIAVSSVALTAAIHISLSERAMGKFQGVVETRLDEHQERIKDHEQRLRRQEQHRVSAAAAGGH